MNNSISPSIGTSYAIDFKFVKNNWLYGLGGGITRLNEIVNMKPNNLLLKITPYQKLDTLDIRYQIVSGDTIWEVVTQTNTYQHIDTTLLSSSYKNKYTFVEIPISFGYNIPLQDFHIYLSGSLIPSIRIKNNSNVIAGSDKSLMYMEKKNVAAFMLSYTINAGIMYPLNNRVYLSGGVVYRNNLSSLFKKEYLVQLDSYSLGVQLGVFHNF